MSYKYDKWWNKTEYYEHSLGMIYIKISQYPWAHAW